jgi:hypothetical protein
MIIQNPDRVEILVLLANMIANSNFVYSLIILFALAGGLGLSLGVDTLVSVKPHLRLRLSAGAIFGLIG